MSKRSIYMKIPCGRNLGHGDSCTEGYTCDSCDYILELEKEIAELKEFVKIICSAGRIANGGKVEILENTFKLAKKLTEQSDE